MAFERTEGSRPARPMRRPMRLCGIDTIEGRSAERAIPRRVTGTFSVSIASTPSITRTCPVCVSTSLSVLRSFPAV